MFLRREGSGTFSLLTLAALLASALWAFPAGAQTSLLNEVHTIAAPTTGVPIEETFDVSTAGTYTVTVTDLGASLTPTPAPLASVKLAVTSGDALVGAPLVGAGTLTLDSLAPGTYKLHVVGMPGNTPGSGPIGIQVNGPGNTSIGAFQDTLALPSGTLPNGEGALDGSFMVSSSGNYTVTLTDFKLPVSLQTLTLLLIQAGSATPLAILPDSGSMQATVALTAGVTYDIFAVGQADATANAGLFGAVVAPAGGGAIVFGRAVPVGNTVLVGSPALGGGGNATLTLSDLNYPASLSQLGAVLTLDGQSVVTLSAAGSQAFTAAVGTYDLYAVAAAPTSGAGAGSYAVQVTPASGAALFSVARAVTASGSVLSSYSFDTSIATAGPYTVSLADFQFPSTLASLQVGAVQKGALLGTPLTTAGDLNISAAAGPLSLLVFTQATASGGLFGIDVTPGAGGAAVYDVTQGVGTLFSARQVAIPSDGSYSVTATDLGFPAKFANYDTIVTQGSKSLGYIFGGGTFNFAATKGTYFVNFIAQATGADAAGTYALAMATAPPAPVVTLSVDKPQVSSGSTVDIIWSSQNATKCTASGGWSGDQPLSGTVTSAALTMDTTFTLACTGDGGSQSKSASVTVTAASSGGGGAIDIELLTLLFLLSCLRMQRPRNRPARSTADQNEIASRGSPRCP
jgi:hypothetical protein